MNHGFLLKSANSSVSLATSVRLDRLSKCLVRFPLARAPRTPGATPFPLEAVQLRARYRWRLVVVGILGLLEGVHHTLSTLRVRSFGFILSPLRTLLFLKCFWK
jgi:hypothetical protein